MGFERQNLSTAQSLQSWENWKANKCQPNYWVNVLPNPKLSCGPYSLNGTSSTREEPKRGVGHDTIGMIVVDSLSNFTVGTSTNGKAFKIAGRVGDSPIIGSGAFVDNDYGYFLC